MRRLFLVAVLFTALAAVPAVEAQIRGTPPSVSSINPRWTSTRPSASVTSLGPHGFEDFRGHHFGGHKFGGHHFGGHGSGFGVSIGFGHNPRFKFHFGSRFGHRRFRHHRRRFAPVYVPYYYPAYPVVYGQPVTVVDPAYADSAYYDDMYDEGPGPTVFDRRSQYIRRDQDDRYGEHYFDPREEARRELEERDARVRQRREAQEEQDAPAPRGEKGADAEPVVEEVATTVLIFRNGTRREVRNYAIVGDTLWELTASRARRIPLAELDLKATMRVNDESGVGFRLPKAADNGPAPLPRLRP